jgi:hypothetical protein
MCAKPKRGTKADTELNPATGQTPAEIVKIAARRQQVIDLYMLGKTLPEIAVELGVSRQTTWRDWLAVEAEWKSNRLAALDNHIRAQLSKLDRAEHEAWAAWEASKNPDVVTKTVESDGPHGAESREERTERPQTGNPSYLAAIQSCIERRCKLLGLDAPTKIAPVTPDGDAPYTLTVELENKARQMTDEQLQEVARVRSLFDLSGQVAGSNPAGNSE